MYEAKIWCVSIDSDDGESCVLGDNAKCSERDKEDCEAYDKTMFSLDYLSLKLIKE